MLTPLTSLRLTDRSRHERGLEHCPRARYLEYHAGPHGYGWRARAQSMPALTGTYTHQPITTVLARMIETDAIPPPEHIQEAIDVATADYQRVVAARGLVGVAEETLATRMAEQTTLLAGLTWAWVRTILPGWHAARRPLLVEHEAVTVLGCTCGLGDGIGTAEEHDGRECGGVGYQTRGDVIAERREDPRTLSYHECKTTGQASQNWEAQWAYRVQLVSGVLGAERLLERRIDEAYIHALVKGRYAAPWSPATRSATGPKYQQSPLVYGWRRPANPGLYDEEWAAEYNYTDELGNNRRLSKDFQRTGVWELPKALWQQGDCQSPSDYWTRWISPEILAAQVRVIGPFYREDWKLERFTRQLTAEEARWQQILWALYELTEAGHGWGDPPFMAELDRLVPQATGGPCSNHFGAVCPFTRLCFAEPGWQDPALMGYLPRRPHHQPELDQAVARGLLVPEEGLAEDEAGEGD